jgi:sporulation protein YlmC with PRC-barrel domain
MTDANTLTAPTTADTQTNLILASRVIHTPVFTIDADRLGHVDDISIDRESGQCVYGIMSFGGFLGIGEKYHPLPWDVLRYDTGVGGFIIMMTREELQQAPHYTRDELTKLGGARHHPRDVEVSNFYQAYGVIR